MKTIAHHQLRRGDLVIDEWEDLMYVVSLPTSTDGGKGIMFDVDTEQATALGKHEFIHYDFRLGKKYILVERSEAMETMMWDYTDLSDIMEGK